MGAFGSGEQFGGELWRVLACFLAGLAVPEPRLAAVESDGAFSTACPIHADLVGAGHDIVTIQSYAPTGEESCVRIATSITGRGGSPPSVDISQEP